MTLPPSPQTRLLRRLESIADLTAQEIAAVIALPLEVKRAPENTDLVSQGGAPSACCLLIEGYACRYKVLSEGQRQILSFHMAGDVPDLQSLHLKVMDHSLGALTPVVVGWIPHAAVHETVREHPGLGSVFWRETLIDAAVLREWLVGAGRRTARQQMAHIICELLVRMKAVDLADDHALILPFTQEELGDALGLTSVHVNRVLGDLKREGLITGHGRTVKVTDWAGLQAIAEFDPVYLHIRDRTG